LRDEGPFGDHTGYYTLPEPYPVFHVTAITHRKDAVYPATIVGIPPMEDFYIGGAALTRPAATLSHRMGEGLGVRVQDELPRDRGPRAAACLPGGRAEGVFHNLVFVSIRKTYPMQAYKVLADGHQCTASGAWAR
jgi:4-hydroxy-3-polyprenylbenzoate decarboxylase